MMVFKSHESYRNFYLFQVKEIGDTALTVTSTTDIADVVFTNSAANDASSTALMKTFAASIRTKLNALENKINGYTTPDCSS